MRQVLLRAGSLLRRPWVVLALLLLAGGGAALCWAPLFGLPGFELSAALTLGLGLLGGGVGVAAAALERRMIQGRDPRPAQAFRRETALGAVLTAFATTTLLLGVAAALPLLVATGRALTSSACNPLAHAGFVPVLLVPTLLLAAAAGVFCGLFARRTGLALLLYFGLLAGSLAHTLWPVWAGPQVFAFNHFLGYFPGPLYDEALAVKPALYAFRAQSVVWAGFFLFLTAFSLNMREGVLSRPHFRPGSAAGLALWGLLLFTFEERATSWGFRMTQEQLAEHLGGLRESPHFVLYYPRGNDAEDVERLVRDLEFRHAQLSAFFGQAPGERLRVFLYRSVEEKHALVGAARTQFAKPWRREIHLNPQPFPHPVLKHELAHLMAAPFGAGPFQVTTRWGLLPVMALVEGMAVAAEDPVQDLSLHAWAAGMRKQKLAPDLRKLLSPEGFFQQAPSRAYTLTGSFLRHLAETDGPEKLRALYAHGDFEAVYGQSAGALVDRWEAFVDAIPLDEASLHQAFARFRHSSLFARACAREVAVLEENAHKSLKSDPTESLELYGRCAALQPEEPAHVMGQARALRALGRLGDAADLLKALRAKVFVHPALMTEVSLAEADLALERGRLPDAQAHLERILEFEPGPAAERTARVKLAAVHDEAARPAILAYFETEHQDLRLLQLDRGIQAQPQNLTLHYLIGRRLEQVGAPTLAARHLALALAHQELPAAIQKEALRLRVQALYLSGDCAGLRSQLQELPAFGEAFARQTGEFGSRCDFEEKAFAGTLSPKEPFR